MVLVSVMIKRHASQAITLILQAKSARLARLDVHSARLKVQVNVMALASVLLQPYTMVQTRNVKLARLDVHSARLKVQVNVMAKAFVLLQPSSLMQARHVKIVMLNAVFALLMVKIYVMARYTVIQVSDLTKQLWSVWHARTIAHHV
jgi:hypothetical protein